MGDRAHMPRQQHDGLTSLFYRLRDSITASEEYDLRREFERVYSAGYADGHLQGHASARRDAEAAEAEHAERPAGESC